MTAEEIAAGLTEAQRKAIIRTRGDDEVGYWFSMGTARGVPQELKARSIYGHYLTPLGMQVRAILESNHDRA